MTEQHDVAAAGAPVAGPAGIVGRRRVVVGVDGTAGSRAALLYAWLTAAGQDAELEVVGAYSLGNYWLDLDVYDPLLNDGVRSVTEERVSRLVEEVRRDPAVSAAAGADLPVRTVLVARSAAPALLDRSQDADLLVVGSRGRGRVRSAVLGSVALHCVTHARCPVVVVHATTADASGPARVVVGIDGSLRSRTALLRAMGEARRLDADLEVVAAYEPADTWTDLPSAALPAADDLRAMVERRTQDLVTDVLDQLPEGDAPGPAVRITVEEGRADDVLLDRAHGAAMLVVGSTGRGQLRGLLLGSVALHCAMHAPCPVMVVHPQLGRGAEPAERSEPAAVR